MTNNGNALKDLNCEQLISYVGELMFEYRRTHDTTAYAIYFHSQLQLVKHEDIPSGAQVLFMLLPKDMINGLTRFQWNNLKPILIQLQHEVLTCGIESKLLPSKKVKSSCSS